MSVAASIREKLLDALAPERLEVVSELPTTPSGKIQKFELEKQLAERLAE